MILEKNAKTVFVMTVKGILWFVITDAKTVKNVMVIRDIQDGNLGGIVYGAVSTYEFSDLINIEEFAESSNPDMLHLKSKLTDVELDIYSWGLEDYKIKHSESTIYVKLKNKPEVALMY